MNHRLVATAAWTRVSVAGLLGAACLAALAQTSLPKVPPPPLDLPKQPVLKLPAGNWPVLAQPNGSRPVSASAASAFAQALAAANAEAAARAAQLRPIATAPLPANCDRRIVAYGSFGSATSFTLRPGQQVVVQGCFGSAPPGEMRLNGVGNGGHTTLQIIDWKPNHVHAKLPELSGVYDGDVRLQLKFGDGDFSNELAGKFVAARSRYALSGQQIQAYATIAPVGPLPVGSDWYSWSGNFMSNESSSTAPTAFLLHGTNAVMVVTPGSKLGSYEVRPRAKQMQLQGYYAALLGGQSQFSHWGPNGEMRLDWSTTPLSTHPWAAVHFLRFDKLVVEAPVGTLPGATALPN